MEEAKARLAGSLNNDFLLLFLRLPFALGKFKVLRLVQGTASATVLAAAPVIYL
jgi:hypothetical protein